MALPHGAVGWSTVCDCGSSRSYPLTSCVLLNLTIISLAKKELTLSYKTIFMLTDSDRGISTAH